VSWFAVDDYLPAHRKVMALRSQHPDRALAALGLWTLCGSWAASDPRAKDTGYVPRYVVDTFAGVDAGQLAGALVDAELWQLDADGYAFHDWADWNGPDAKARRIDQRRASDRARQQRSRDARKEAL
jgi:hypothetical protein